MDACIVKPSANNVLNAFDVERRLNPADLLNNLVGLVTVEPDFDRTLTPAPKSRYIVSLAHFSVREFLLPSRRKRAGRLELLNNFEASLVHELLAKSCLAYIVHCALSEYPKSDDFVLRDYAWHWWAGHLVAGVCTDSVNATRLALRLFNFVVFPIVYSRSEQSRDIEMGEMRAHLQNLMGFLQPREQDVLVKALSDTEFSCGMQDTRQDRASGQNSIKRPLPDDPRALRLLVLHPPQDGKPSELLEGSLCTEVLDNKPVYTALSYTWGPYVSRRLRISESEGVDRVIDPMFRVDGKMISLRPNLLDALSHLRLREAPRVLWVDALCISMQDLSERSAQVQRMSDIYRSAEEVAAWLGKARSSSGEAMQLLRSNKGLSADEASGPDSDIVSNSELSAEHNGRILNELFSRSLWTRSWVIQEIVFASRVTLHCGAHSLDWEDIRRIDKLPTCTHDEKANQHCNPRAAASALQKLRREYLSGSQLGLDELLRITRNHSCTMLADKVFSLLGFLPGPDAGEDLLKVDYERSWTLVYGLAAQYILIRTQNLNLLSESGGTTNNERLPSWVPDWSRLFSSLITSDLYNVNGDHARFPHMTFPRPGLSLAVEGIIVDSIDSIFDNSRSEGTQELVQTRLSLIKQVPQGQTKLEVYGATMVASWLSLEGKRWERHGRLFPEDWSQTEREEEIFDSQLNIRYSNHSFFVTNQGYSGFTQIWAQEGDLIVILPGGRTPYVLRKTSETSKEVVSCRLVAQW